MIDTGITIKLYQFSELSDQAKRKAIEQHNSFDYQMLGRYQSDCDYYLGYGNRYVGHLYFKNEQKHINAMKELYNKIPDNAKPEWLTWKQILEYEKEMVS